jgi:hypothetical protein
MRAGGDHGMRRANSASAPVGGDGDGLGAFASESEEAAPAHAPHGGLKTALYKNSAARQALESPALVPLVVALAVVGYGALTVVWWERDRPAVKPSFSSMPTTSFRPSAPQPLAPEPVAPVAPVATMPLAAESPDIPETFFVPTVARVVDSPVRAVETAVTLPLPQPLESPPPDATEDAVPVPSPTAPAMPPPAVAAAPAAIEAAVTAAPRPVEPRAVDRMTADRNAIGDVLRSYQAAYNALDATSVSTIWQGLDTRGLQRAFSTLTEQDVSFDRCDVSVTDAEHAVASCRGVLRYVPRIGDGEPQQRRLSWSFDFQRAADRWLISSVSAR